jgi:hypothetical protein
MMVPRIDRNKLNKNHGYLLDTGFYVFIWFGTNVKQGIKVNPIQQSTTYFKKHKWSILPMTLFKSGLAPPLASRYSGSTPTVLLLES